MVHDYYTRGKKQELVVKMNQDSQIKDMEDNLLSSVNSQKDEILNLKEIVIENPQNENEKNFEKNVSDLRDVVQSTCLTIMLWQSMVVKIM